MRTPLTPQSDRPLLARLLLLSWVIIILLGTTLPWHTIHPQLQWWRIDWSPFHGGALRPRMIFDVAVNVVLYLPFGYLFRQWVGQRNGPMTFVYVMGMAAALSCSTEFIQIFNPVRFPAMADVVMNIIGALLGAWAVVPEQKDRSAILALTRKLGAEGGMVIQNYRKG
jgi:glycopeptide antibiotics resistance protein